MEIVGALDLHRRQITYRWDDVDTGEVNRGKIVPGDREAVRTWLSQFAGRDVHLALEATTGWRFVVEEMHAAGLTPHLAEPTETHSKRGRKRRAKTDRADCEHLLKLLKSAELPESWIPPAHVLEWRALARLRKTLVDERTAWRQRLRAQLFHHGAPAGIRLSTREGRARLAELELAPSAHQVIATGLSVIDHLDEELKPLERHLASIARRQPGCVALQGKLYGVGKGAALAIVTELGDCRRFSRSMQAVRHAGLDVTVHSSDLRRSPGHLSHQGPELLRWMLFEAAQCAARKTSPDYAYFIAARERLGYEQACLCVARKLARRAYHILRKLGADAVAPVDDASPAPHQLMRAA